MNLLDRIYEKAKQNPQKVAFPEALNEKMMQAAYETGKEGYILPILVGNEAEIRAAVAERGYDESIFQIVDISEEGYKQQLIEKYVALPNTRLKEKALARRMQDKLYYAMVMQAVGDADVTFAGIADQLGYRRDTILSLLAEAGISLDDVDVFVGRGGGLLAVEGGTYEVTDIVLEHARTCANGVIHPAALGPQLAHEFAEKYQARAMVVNPPDVDELQDLARMTGIKGVNRVIHLHALNLKETAIRHSKNVLHRNYEDCNYVVCHIGGGISISAHRKGRMVDGYDIVGGEGPMAPTRCGSVSVADLVKYIEKNNVSLKELKDMCSKTGDFVSHTGISDVLELTRRGEKGDKYADLLWNTMLYQIEKAIGAMAAVLHGDIDGILVGGMARDKDLVKKLTEACSFIAPITFYPGEFEMEAMAAGAVRVLNGEEELKVYSGKPIWDGFEWDE